MDWPACSWFSCVMCMTPMEGKSYEHLFTRLRFAVAFCNVTPCSQQLSVLKKNAAFYMHHPNIMHPFSNNATVRGTKVGRQTVRSKDPYDLTHKSTYCSLKNLKGL